ncbi:MAG: GNAT family N-acetyltransferase [Burkholderiales bacterium]|nr:GNAT family N-acetyltransferase [Burkholderiales bacterium]
MSGPVHSIHRATTSVQTDAERILRSLPGWFGLEDALREYAQDTSLHPTFVATNGNAVSGFITVKHHFPPSAEIHCVAVEAQTRGQGLGRALVRHAQAWAADQGVRFLQIKTLAESHPSPEYAQTRAFYLRMGFVPLELFPSLWSSQNPCLQMIKQLP